MIQTRMVVEEFLNTLFKDEELIEIRMLLVVGESGKQKDNLMNSLFRS